MATVVSQLVRHLGFFKKCICAKQQLGENMCLQTQIGI